jgi:hypothetical protein
VAGGRGAGRRAGAVIEDLEADRVDAVADGDRGAPGFGVADDVGERLLDDPVAAEVDRGGDRPGCAFDPQLGTEPAQRARSTKVDSSASAGAGSGCASSSGRSCSRVRASSLIASRPSEAIESPTRRASSSSPAPRAWAPITISERPWPTTSWSSRAIRRRSAATAGVAVATLSGGRRCPRPAA